MEEAEGRGPECSGHGNPWLGREVDWQEPVADWREASRRWSREEQVQSQSRMERREKNAEGKVRVSASERFTNPSQSQEVCEEGALPGRGGDSREWGHDRDGGVSVGSLSHEDLVEELRGLRREFDRLGARLEQMLQSWEQAWLSHESYHREHEHRWGFLRLVQRYPGRAVLLGVGLVSLAWSRNPGDWELIRSIISALATPP